MKSRSLSVKRFQRAQLGPSPDTMSSLFTDFYAKTSVTVMVTSFLASPIPWHADERFSGTVACRSRESRSRSRNEFFAFLVRVVSPPGNKMKFSEASSKVPAVVICRCGVLTWYTPYSMAWYGLKMENTCGMAWHSIVRYDEIKENKLRWSICK